MAQTTPNYDIQSRPNKKILIKNAKIYTNSNTIISKGMILFNNGIIENVGETFETPKRCLCY